MNRLSTETSPYLLQHAENPVDWLPWGEEGLARAREQDKPILLSIGYAACHWCHVMAHESFEDEQTAALMNEHYVNIKVDREERPDIDAVYMEATVSSTTSRQRSRPCTSHPCRYAGTRRALSYSIFSKCGTSQRSSTE